MTTQIQRDRRGDATAAAVPDPNRTHRLELSVTVPTPPGARQVDRARDYITRVTAQLPPRRAMGREYLALLGHATALLSAVDAGGIDPPETAARRVMAEVVLSGFTREAQAFASGGPVPDWLAYAHRLAQALRGLLGALEESAPPAGAREAFQRAAIASSGVAPDGSGRLSPADLLLVLGALSDGAAWADTIARRPEDATAYRALSYRLGDDK
jgi:hypothetical protein